MGASQISIRIRGHFPVEIKDFAQKPLGKSNKIYQKSRQRLQNLSISDLGPLCPISLRRNFFWRNKFAWNQKYYEPSNR